MIPFLANAYDGLHGPHATEGLIKNAATGGGMACGVTIRFWPKAGRTTKQVSRQNVRVIENLMFVRSIHPLLQCRKASYGHFALAPKSALAVWNAANSALTRLGGVSRAMCSTPAAS